MKRRSCQNCRASFDRHDLVPFIVMRPGNTLNCLHCLDLNYLVPNRTTAYWIVFSFASALGLFLMSLVFDLLGFMGFRLNRMGIVSTIVAMVFIIAGLILSLWFSRFILKLWNWKNGTLTLDDNRQSVLDLG